VSDQDAATPIEAHIAGRIELAGVTISRTLTAQLAAYLVLLGKWNRAINLTALPLDPPTDEAIDRLIVEPVAAARLVRPGDRRAIDIGSGGGSPAIPLNLAAPQLAFTLVEVKTRKSAFLREAGRELAIPQLAVETMRAEELRARAAFRAAADLVTVRAVRVDRTLLETVVFLLAPGGRLIWFGGAGDFERMPAADRCGFTAENEEPVPAGTAVLII
jgi:16S rRNA (guanine527-N7)-methyltransferase